MSLQIILKVFRENTCCEGVIYLSVGSFFNLRRLKQVVSAGPALDGKGAPNGMSFTWRLFQGH